MGEIRWLYESNDKTPEQEVIEEEDKKGTELYKDIIRYQRANNVQSKDKAVAGMLNKLVAPGAGDKLQKSLGIGFLTRFMSAFKLGSANEDNLFIRLLSAIWNQKDGEAIKKILCGERPQGQDPQNNNTQMTQKVKDTQSKEGEVSKIPNVNYTKKAINSSLTEGSDLNVPDDAATMGYGYTDDNTDEKPNLTMSQEEAKILDMSARDLFLVLYNGYLTHTYTGQDLLDIDNDPKDNNHLTDKNGKIYPISPSLKEIVLKSQNSEDAFKYAGDKDNNYNRRNYKEVSDLKDKIIRYIKNLSPQEKEEVIQALK